MIEVADIIISKCKAFVPVYAQIEGASYFAVEPVYTANLKVDDLVESLEKVIEAGHPIISPPTKEDMQQGKDPILRASGVKSWNKLAKDGASYSLFWGEDKLTLYMSRLDRKGRFETDPNKTQTFPKDTPLQVVVKAILADAKQRPELGL